MCLFVIRCRLPDCRRGLLRGGRREKRTIPRRLCWPLYHFKNRVWLFYRDASFGRWERPESTKRPPPSPEIISRFFFPFQPTVVSQHRLNSIPLISFFDLTFLFSSKKAIFPPWVFFWTPWWLLLNTMVISSEHPGVFFWTPWCLLLNTLVSSSEHPGVFFWTPACLLNTLVSSSGHHGDFFVSPQKTLGNFFDTRYYSDVAHRGHMFTFPVHVPISFCCLRFLFPHCIKRLWKHSGKRAAFEKKMKMKQPEWFVMWLRRRQSILGSDAGCFIVHFAKAMKTLNGDVCFCRYRK